MHREGERHQAMVNVLKRHRRKSCCFCSLLCYSSIQNLILLRWAYPNLDQDQTERSSLLTETGYNNAGSQKEMTCYNTKKYN